MGPPLSYPKGRRLRKRRDFVRVQDRSGRVTTPHFILLIAPRPSSGPCRLGVVTSKKVGCAVVRNRTKRLVREAFRTRPELFPQGIDLVVIAKQGGPEDLSLSTVCREIEGVASLLARKAREALREPRQSLPMDPGNSPPGVTGK